MEKSQSDEKPTSQNELIDSLTLDETQLITNFRRSNRSDRDSIEEYAALCAAGWPAHASAGEYKPEDSDDTLIHLHDLSFDFEDYFERHSTGEMPEAEREEFSARVYGLFCRDVFRSGGDMRRAAFWSANYVAEKLFQALGGVPWEDIMNLPWDAPTPFLTPKGERALNIYAAVTNAMVAHPHANTTDLISEQARRHNVSYETARAAYYAVKGGIQRKTGLPKNFLINGDKI